MKFRFYFLALLFTLVFSCNKSDDTSGPNPKTEDLKDKEPIAEDETKPIITVNGFTDIIEIVTEISISIVDDSTVETKILHNGEELAVSSDKQFAISINPYPMTVGLTDFIVVSKDAKGNEISETYSVEIKHLLMTYAFRTQVGDFYPERWLFLSDLDGKELAVIEASDGDIKIYSDELVLSNTILITELNYIAHVFSNQTHKNLNARTYKVLLGEVRVQGTPSVQTELENTVEVILNGVPFVNNSPDYLAWGYGYNTTAYSGDELQTTLTIKHSANTPIYIRTNRFGGNTPKFDGKKENYRYIALTPEPGNTSITVEADQLKLAENNLKLDIPEHDAGSLFVHRYGSENAEDFDFYRSFSIYDKDSDNDFTFVDYIDLPLFPMLNYYYIELSYRKNDFYYSTRGTDDNLDVNMPNWTATTQLSDTAIDLVANNAEVDYYTVELQKKEFDAAGGITMTWNYSVFEEDGSTKSVARLEVPESITKAIGDTYFETTVDMEINGLAAFDYDKFNSYKEVVDYLVFSKTTLKSSENKYRSVSFPISSNSGKSKIPNRQWNVEDSHPYGLDEKSQVRLK